MIQYLGKITIPQDMVADVKNRDPDRVAYQLESDSHKSNLIELDSTKYNIDGYSFYAKDSTVLKEYFNEAYLDIVPTSFLLEHKLARPKNALILRVDPGTFTRPHKDTFKNSLLKKYKDLVFDDIIRLWIPLEDSTFGQAFFVGNEVISKYHAGDVYTFDNYAMHSAANAGLDIRYTLLVYTSKL